MTTTKTRDTKKKVATKKTSAKQSALYSNTTQPTKHIKMHVLDKEVQLACKPGEEEDLKQAVAYIDKSMRDLRSRSASSSTEKIAIVTAINTASALLKSRHQSTDNPALTDRIASVNAKLDQMLEEDTA